MTPSAVTHGSLDLFNSCQQMNQVGAPDQSDFCSEHLGNTGGRYIVLSKLQSWESVMAAQ